MKGDYAMTGLKTAAVFLLAVLLAQSGCVSRESMRIREDARAAGMRLRYQPIEWVKVQEFDFESSGVMDKFIVVEGDWEVRGGRLCAVYGDRNRAILLARGFEGPLRVEMEVVNYASDGLMGDITILLNSSPDSDFFRSGYALTTGSYWNTLTTFYKKGAAVANTSWSPIASGRKNHVVVEFNDGHIRYELNGKRILEAWDENPLIMTDEGWIGVRTWSTLMCVERVAVYKGHRAADETP